MKILTCFMSGLTLILLAACASTTPNESKVESTKYTFNNLTSVRDISNWELDGWNIIDDRSLIVQTSPSHYYLLILSRPNSQLSFSESILISSTGGSVEARFDTVSAVSEPMIKTPIEKIYRLNGREQVAEVRQQIKGE